MGKFIVRLLDGTELPLENATAAQVARAISIIRVKDTDKTMSKKP